MNISSSRIQKSLINFSKPAHLSIAEQFHNLMAELDQVLPHHVAADTSEVHHGIDQLSGLAGGQAGPGKSVIRPLPG